MSSIATDDTNPTFTTTSHVKQRLCGHCQRLSLSRITGSGFKFHLNFRQLSLAAGDLLEGCCDLCFVLWWSLRWHASKLGELGDADVFLYKNPPNQDPIQQIEVVVAPDYKRNEFSWSEDVGGAYHLGPPDDKPWLACGYVSVVAASRSSLNQTAKPLARYCLPADNSGSKECLSLASQWLSDCLEHHGATCPANIDSRLPRRVIDVGIKDEDETLRLMTTTTERGTYLALSYCWGTDPFFLMTADNRSELEQSIPLKILPKTLQDAVILTRQLGVRYLWVDSLCIIQGSDEEALEDWEEQSRCMNTVYRGALATICASSAAGAHEGVFADRRARSDVSCTLPVSSGSGEVVHLLGDQAEDMITLQEPLEKRAWAFQEDFLSIRVLSFTSKELTWRCRGSKHRECDSQSTFRARPKDHEATNIHETWSSIVEEYSGRSLTVSSDKLPGIVGLARLVQAYLPPFYFSGVWEDRVVEQLLWKHIGRIGEGSFEYKRLQTDRVPSWSWASVEGKVKFLQGADPAYCKIISLSDQCIVAQAHVQKIETIRLAVTAGYFGGYDNYLPWAAFPALMKTYLDDLDAIPKENRKSAPGSPEELIDVSFLFLGPSCGLILLRQRGSGRMSSYGHLRRHSEGTAGGDALRSPLELPVKREYRRIGSFVGFGHGVGFGSRPRRIPSTTVHLI